MFDKDKKKKILIIEDEPDIAESIQIRLKLSGYQIAIASDGEAGVLLARKEKPDLIILDIMMPKLDGFEVCQMLRSDPAFKTVPFVFLTARQAVGDVDRAFEVGASDYLSKPFTNERLLAKVKKFLP